MAKRFNLVRYQELLELEKNNKIDFLDSKLLYYKTIVGYQISYNRRE